MWAYFQIQSIYLYRQPVDMRKGMDGLSSLVRSELDLDPMSPSLFSLIEAMIKLSCYYGSVIAFGSFISDL